MSTKMKIRNILIAFALLIMGATHVHAQMAKPVYRQFFFNPYLLNPGFIGASNQTELNMFYKKQWLGISDAPSVMGVSMQIPTSERVALGLNVTADKQVILKNTSFTGTFGYLVPMGKEQSLRFALTTGVGMNRFDFTAEELNSNDPAVQRVSGNTLSMQGNFGAVYRIKGLQLGFALTELFGSDPLDEDAHNSFSMKNLKNRLLSASYRFDLDPFQNFQMEPYVLYNETLEGDDDYLEGAAMVHYQKKVWSGASYNDRHGIALHFGMEVMSQLKFSYSYEFPPMGKTAAVSNSHEFHLRLMLGKPLDKRSYQQPRPRGRIK